MNRRYRVVSRTRFSLFIIAVVLIIALGVNGLFLGKVHGASPDKSYYVITVRFGDTLWSIAENHYDDNQDIRKAIYEISCINSIENGVISVGQQLLIPA